MKTETNPCPKNENSRRSFKLDPLWEKLEKESKSGEEFYQKALEAGLLKSNFPKEWSEKNSYALDT